MLCERLTLNGRTVANHFLIYHDGFIWFQSYTTIIAKYNKKTKVLAISPEWNVSRTTRKWFGYFINKYTAYKYSSKKQFSKFIEENYDVQIMS